MVNPAGLQRERGGGGGNFIKSSPTAAKITSDISAMHKKLLFFKQCLHTSVYMGKTKITFFIPDANFHLFFPIFYFLFCISFWYWSLRNPQQRLALRLGCLMKTHVYIDETSGLRSWMNTQTWGTNPRSQVGFWNPILRYGLRDSNRVPEVKCRENPFSRVHWVTLVIYRVNILITIELFHTYLWSTCSHIQYLLETKDKTKTGEIIGLYRETLKTKVLHELFCVQSLWENLNYRDIEKNKRSLHRDACLRIYFPLQN